MSGGERATRAPYGDPTQPEVCMANEVDRVSCTHPRCGCPRLAPFDPSEFAWALDVVEAARAFVNTTTVFRLRKESRDEFTDLAVLLAERRSEATSTAPSAGKDGEQ